MADYDIIYEDADLLVCHKWAGLATQSGKIGQKDLVTQIKTHLSKQESENARHKDVSSGADKSRQRQKAGNKKTAEPYVALINRLDQPVEGLVLFAKRKEAAANLTKQLELDRIHKYYYAGYAGSSSVAEGICVDYLLQNRQNNTSAIVPKDTQDAKKAVLEFVRLQELQQEQMGCMQIHLITGRHHQIRVQMAGAGLPLLGDYKYAPDTVQQKSKALGIRNIALCAYKLELTHPTTGEPLCFEIHPKGAWAKRFLL